MKKSELKQLIRECINEATSPAKATDTGTIYQRWDATRPQEGVTDEFLKAVGQALRRAIGTSLGGSPNKFSWMGSTHNKYGSEDAWLQMNNIAKINETGCHLQLTFHSKKKTLDVYVHADGSQFGKYTDVTDAVNMKDIISGIEKSIEQLRSRTKPAAPKDKFNFS